MRYKIHSISEVIGKLDRRRIQLALLVLTLILFVISGGAPEASGGCSSC